MAKNKFVITDENMPVASDTTIGAGIVEQPEVTLRYDYNLVPAVDRDELMAAAVRIKQLDSRASRHIWQIGKELVEHKQYVPHGQWLPWLEKEFDYSDTMAQVFMNTYRKFPNFGDLQGLGRSVLGLLASGTTPPEIVDAVVEEARQGNPPTFTEVKKRIAGVRRKALPPPVNNGAAEQPAAPAAGANRDPIIPPLGSANFVSSAGVWESYSAPTAGAAISPAELDFWLVAFRQTVALLAEYVAKTGDEYHGDAAQRHLESVIEDLERRLRG
jgi:hypothetical protein